MTPVRCDVLVYGGGAAALKAGSDLANSGCHVILAGPVDAARWPSLPTGGIECGDDPEAAFIDAIVGGDYLAERAPVRALMRAASSIVDDLIRIGVPFARDGAKLRRRRLDGMRSPRGVFVEARTTRSVIDALDDQATRLGIERLSHHALETLIADARGRFAGCILHDRANMQLIVVEAQVLILALGGSELTLAGSATAVATEAGLAVAFDAGATLANMEFLQTMPAAIWLGPRVQGSPRGRRALVPSSSLIGEGAGYWLPSEPAERRLGRQVPRDERRPFLETSFPGWGSAAPNDLTTRVVREELAKGGLYDHRRGKHQPLVYLDLSHLPERHLRERVGSELDLYRRLSGADPYRGPLPIHPALSDRLGGLWVDFDACENGDLRADSPRNHATTLEGVYACAGATHLYHGANRLSGNLLLADLFGARSAASAARAYRAGREASKTQPFFERALATTQAVYQEIRLRKGGEAPVVLQARLRELLHAKASFSRHGSGLESLCEDLVDLTEATARARARDDANATNRGVALIRDLEHATLLATITARSALLRRESRGVHHRSDETGSSSLKDETIARAKPRLTLVRRHEAGLQFEQRARSPLQSEGCERSAFINEEGVTETTHPRRYSDTP